MDKGDTYMRSWVVNLNLKFVNKYNVPFNSFVIKAEEKEEFLVKMDRVLIKVMELVNLKLMIYHHLITENYQKKLLMNIFV